MYSYFSSFQYTIETFALLLCGINWFYSELVTHLSAIYITSCGSWVILRDFPSKNGPGPNLHRVRCDGIRAYGGMAESKDSLVSCIWNIKILPTSAIW